MLIGIDLTQSNVLEDLTTAAKTPYTLMTSGFGFDIGSYRPGSGINRLLQLTPDELSHSTATSRWEHLYLAMRGARIYSDHLSEESPLYAGKMPTSLEDVRRAVVAARFAEGRSEYFSRFGVNYIGRAHLSPRNLIVVDNKNGGVVAGTMDTSLEALYGSLPDDWWGSCGFVSTGNVDKLGAFLDAIPETIVLAYSDGALAKLKYLGVDHAKIDPPVATERYGISVRERANRLSYDLSFK